MYEEKTMALIVKRVCEEFKKDVNIFPNGSRCEGYSFVAIGEVDSKVVERLIEVINEASPDEGCLTCWSVQIGRNQLPCEGVSEFKTRDCIEIRLRWR